MATSGAITPVAEDAADERVQALFGEIKAGLEVAEVPLFYRIIAHIPLYLETTWQRLAPVFERIRNGGAP